MKVPLISDYALIGNSRAAALVSNRGSIDWCCLPEFDSPSIFAFLLDSEKGGYFSISPSDDFHSSQKYVADTNVVETQFTSGGAVVCCYDAFVADTEETKANSLFPDHEILRIVEGIKGTIKMKMVYAPRTYYGKHTPTLKNKKRFGIHFEWKENNYCLLSSLDPDQIAISEENNASAYFELKAGQRVIFSLSCCDQSPAVIQELQLTAFGRMSNTIQYWRRWISKCKYNGIYSEDVKRSALTLKLLSHAPSGAIIAAPTTSIPEKIGGGRNWDYRYCWLRDASFTVRVLLKLGFEEEVHAYMNWILHATHLTRPKLQVVYSTYGHARLPEKELHWLSGYKNSLPVRIKNNADDQFQLDVYGEVLDAIYTYSDHVKQFDKNSKNFMIGLGKVICNLWEQPDNGIWEIRSSLMHHTHSKVMCWVGLDRLIKLCKKYRWKGAHIDMFIETAERVRRQVERSGYSERLGSYTRELDGSHLDASALAFSLVGYTDPSSPRMTSTIECITTNLSKNKMVYRYNGGDGIAGDEGSFGICNFWLAENLASIGNVERAEEIFNATARCSSPTGLLSEQVDPESGELLGNYPQGFTHIGLINAALAIDAAHKRRYKAKVQETM
jgi:GH15 family glucan-1,4-alpha-glucosidase